MPYLVLPLSHLVNRCLCEGVLRNVLKTARVVSVYEKGSRDLPSSYRPISMVLLSQVLGAVMAQLQ